MIYLDILIAILLIGVSLVVYFNRKNKNKKYLIIDILLGIFYATTYLMWRYLANNYHIGSPFHIFVLLSAFLLPFIIHYYTAKNEKLSHRVALILSIIVFALILSRFITWPLVLGSSILAALPLNICNIMAVIGLISLLTNNKFLKNIFASIGLLGGAVSLLQAFNEGTNSILNYLSIDSYFLHLLLVTIPIYMILNNIVDFDVKIILKSIYFFPIYYLFCYFFNHYFSTNFLYTLPANVDFLELFYNNLPKYNINGFEIAIWYYLIILVGGSALAVLIVYLEGLVSKQIKKGNNK
jgi:hypothetical protein